MQFGPRIIYECPHCGAGAGVDSLMSGNNIGVKLYSDGIQIAPMLTSFPVETRCQKCKKIFEFEKETDVEDYEATFLLAEDYIEKINNNIGDETYNREMTWHVQNGTYGKSRKKRNEEMYLDNCKKLINLLQNSEEISVKIMVAELYRNIGDFETTKGIIDELPEEYNWIKQKFHEQINKKNTKIFMLHQDNLV